MTPIYSYRRGPKRAQVRQNPELAPQIAVARYLMIVLPADVQWTSSLAGAHLGPSQRAKQKASGLRPGWPDLQLCIRRRMYFIELKAPTTVRSRAPERYGTLNDPDLSDDQRRVLAALHPDAWCICRSLDEIERALVSWGVPLRGQLHELGYSGPS